MGTCPCSNSLNENVAYAEAVSIPIKERDRLGKVIRSDRVKFALNLPVYSESKSSSDNSLKLVVSSCILGGIDPRSLINKECQDGALLLSKEGVFLAGVFDGHGTDGVKIVETVKDLIKSYFLANTSAFRTASQESIKLIINECDKKVRNNSSIDSSISGCTAVVVVITDVIHVGSVGDSKAILAMIGSDPSYTAQKRSVDPGRSIVPLKLAVEQRPNMREELERIKKAGGKVQQLTNDQGVKVGPYRVWKKVGTLPGLAMSRSIGDAIGKEIGVISTPICSSFMFDKKSDLFIVIASDGIWDVMNCQEVINFVEKFRKICQKNSDLAGFPIKPSNATVAHLLAEEARFRWLEVCQEEDVMIDDIAVVVVELEFLEPFKELRDSERHGVEELSLVSIRDSGRIFAGKRGDAVRGSFVPAREVAKRRIDPKRGSYVYEYQRGDEQTLEMVIDEIIENK